MINRSMTPDQLLAKRNYAVIRVDENGVFRWMTNAYMMEGSALSDIDMMGETDDGDHYEVVIINHMGDGDHSAPASDTDSLHARAFRALVRYMFCGLQQFGEQGDVYSTEYHVFRDLLTFAEGYLSSAGEEIAPIVDGVTAEHHV